MTYPALSISRVDIRYDRLGEAPLSIVKDYSLDLYQGQMHCLAGRSGSGKTSILRVAAGLVRPFAGSVSWAGDAITGQKDDLVTARRRYGVGYLDQSGVLMEGLTALENVLLPAVPDKRTKELAPRAVELMTKLGVITQASSFPAKLSGGERQRVALARALLLSPSIVMADEPTASLDRGSADAVISLLRGLAKSGIAVLVAAHDQCLIDAADSRTVLA